MLRITSCAVFDETAPPVRPRQFVNLESDIVTISSIFSLPRIYIAPPSVANKFVNFTFVMTIGELFSIYKAPP